MNLPLILALALLALLGVGLALWFRRASRTTRAVLRAAREQHRLVLRRLHEAASPVTWDEPGEDGSGWATRSGAVEGMRFELGASRGLGGDTKFIDLVTRLEVAVPGLHAQPRVQLPEGANKLLELGLPDDRVAALIAMAYELRIERERLRLAVRPTGPTVHRYSYGIRLTLDPELLVRVVALGVEVGRRLAPPDAALR